MINNFSQKRFSVVGLILFWGFGICTGLFLATAIQEIWDYRLFISFMVMLISGIISFIYTNASEKEWMEQYKEKVNPKARWGK